MRVPSDRVVEFCRTAKDTRPMSSIKRIREPLLGAFISTLELRVAPALQRDPGIDGTIHRTVAQREARRSRPPSVADRVAITEWPQKRGVPGPRPCRHATDPYQKPPRILDPQTAEILVGQSRW
jgi:hypothetical protein